MAVVLSRVQHGERRSSARDRSLRRDPRVTIKRKDSGVAGSLTRDAAIAMDAATFRKLGHRLVDHVAGFLDALPRGPATHDESPSAVREALDLTGPLPESGMDPGTLLEQT